MSAAFSRVFALEVDGRPILAFEARRIREAQEICKGSWLLDDLAGLKSGGAPLRAATSRLSVRPATSEEITVFEQVSQEPSDEMVLAFLIELDPRAIMKMIRSAAPLQGEVSECLSSPIR